MTYVRHYGRPYLFITFTCNLKWKEIQNELPEEELHVHSQDLFARLLKLKVIKIFDVLTKDMVFGPLRCITNSIEWQKCGLHHPHILISLMEKEHSKQIDNIISAEPLDATKHRSLYEIVKT